MSIRDGIIAAEVLEELDRARAKHPRPFASPHEGYAIIAEEVDELWEQVRKKERKHDLPHMRHELIQIAAMCLRFIEDVIDK